MWAAPLQIFIASALLYAQLGYAGLAAVGDIGLSDLAQAHGRWRLSDARRLGVDRVEVYGRERCSPA